MTRRSGSALPSIGSLECATGGQRERTLANEVAPFEGAIRDHGDALHDESTRTLGHAERAALRRLGVQESTGSRSTSANRSSLGSQPAHANMFAE